MHEAKQRVFSGIQPTSDSLHLGNYLGAVQYWVSLQAEFDCVYSVVDLHALTVAPDPAAVRARSRATMAQLLAVGVDPARSALFIQSHRPEHAQLTWLLECLTGFGEASRMTQFKDKSAKQGAEGTNVGLFAYPILQVADILLYDANYVPVGEDQRQHLELSRDVAIRLNSRFGPGTAVVPEPHIVSQTAKIYDLQNPGGKMSKSASPSGTIELLDDPAVIIKRIKSAVTDTESEIRYDPQTKPGISNLLTIYAALTGRPVEAIVADYVGKGYGHLKVDLADVVVGALEPIRTATRDYLADVAELDRLIAAGAERAGQIAAGVYARIADRFGLLPPPPLTRPVTGEAGR